MRGSNDKHIWIPTACNISTNHFAPSGRMCGWCCDFDRANEKRPGREDAPDFSGGRLSEYTQRIPINAMAACCSRHQTSAKSSTVSSALLAGANSGPRKRADRCVHRAISAVVARLCRRCDRITAYKYWPSKIDQAGKSDFPSPPSLSIMRATRYPRGNRAARLAKTYLRFV